MNVRATAWLVLWAACAGLMGGAQRAAAQAPTPTPAPAAAPQIAIGTAERLSGNVLVTSTGAAPRDLRQGDTVHQGDFVATAQDAEVLIRLRDETTMALRQNSQLRVSDFRFERAPADGFAASLLKGAVRTVSGLIGKTSPRNVEVRTPTATVGIRGTDFEISIVEEESESQRAGTYNYVHDGATDIRIASGESLNVERDQTGLALAFPRPGEPALQLIQGRPAFLRGGGFDAMMMQLGRPPMIMMPGRR